MCLYIIFNRLELNFSLGSILKMVNVENTNFLPLCKQYYSIASRLDALALWMFCIRSPQSPRVLLDLYISLSVTRTSNDKATRCYGMARWKITLFMYLTMKYLLLVTTTNNVAANDERWSRAACAMMVLRARSLRPRGDRASTRASKCFRTFIHYIF